MDIFLPLGRHVLNVGVALAVLMAVTSLTLWAMERYFKREFFQVPLFFVMGKVLGLVLGLAFLYVQYQLRYFDFTRLFLPESPWNITVWEFLADRANPFVYGPVGVAGSLWTPGSAVLPLLGAALLTSFAVIVIAAFRVWRPADAWWGIVQTVGFALWISYLILFGVSLLFWLLFWLNVWALLVVAIFVQIMRHRV
jgi:hypothetical protein